MITALFTALLIAQAPPPAPAPSASPAAPAPAAPKATKARPPVPPGPRGDLPAAEPEREKPVLSGFEPPSGKKFTGQFKDTPVGDALREVAKSAGLSIVLPAGLWGTVNADFNGAPVEDVLSVVLSQNELRAERKGSIVSVTRATAGSLVIRGGKRRVEFGSGRENFRVQIDPEEIQREVEKATRDAERAAKDLKIEIRKRHPGPDGAGPAAPEPPEASGDVPEPPEPPDEVDEGPGPRNDRVLSGDQILKPGERVRDLVALRGNVQMMPGSQARQVTAVMGSVEVGPGAQVTHEVVAVGGDVHVRSGAHVGGDVVSVGGKLVLDDGAQIDGQQTSVDIPGLGGILGMLGSHPFRPHEESRALRIGSVLAEFAIFLALGLLMLFIAPRRVDVVGRSLVNTPAKALLTGFLGTLALPVLALLLAVTIVGIPLIAVLVLAVLAGAILGFTALAQMVGERLPLGTRGGQVLRLAVGTVLLVIATRIPVLGVLVWITGWLFIFGAVLRTRFGQQPAAMQTMAVPPPFPPAPPTAAAP